MKTARLLRKWAGKSRTSLNGKIAGILSFTAYFLRKIADFFTSEQKSVSKTSVSHFLIIMEEMIMRKVLCVLTAALLAAAAVLFAACGSSRGENELRIVYYSGGYGESWIQSLADKYMEENEGVTVIANPDTQLIDSVGTLLENRPEDFDLIFCHDVAWESYANRGYIYRLDDMYSSVNPYTGEVYGENMWSDDVAASAQYPDADGNMHYYKVPWTVGTAGIAYNLTVMDRVDQWLASADGQAYLATGNGHITTENADLARRWNRTAPVSYYDLIQYCYDVAAANLPVDASDPTSGTITPFTWSGGGEQWQWDYPLFDWWIQLAGPDTMNTFKNFNDVMENGQLDWNDYKNPDVNVFNPNDPAKGDNVGWQEFKEAYALWYNLVAQNSAWTISGVADLSKGQNESAFANGRAAMTPAANWVAKESESMLAASGQEIDIMATPVVSDVKMSSDYTTLYLPNSAEYDTASVTLDAVRYNEANGDDAGKTIEINGKTYNRVSFTSSFGDSALIPAGAVEAELAVDFLRFMQREDNAQLFTRETNGILLPFDYDYSASYSAAGETASAWAESIFEINENSTKFNNYTQHPMMRNTALRGTARMTTVWYNNLYYYINAYQQPGSYEPNDLFGSIWGDVNESWATYRNQIQ